MNNCNNLSNSGHHGALKNSLTNLDNNMKSNGKKLKDLINFINIKNFKSKENQSELQMNEKLGKDTQSCFEMPNFTQVHSLANQISNSQLQVSSLLKQYKDFEISFMNPMKIDLSDRKNNLNHDISDNLFMSDNDSENNDDSKDNEEPDVFSIDHNAFTYSLPTKQHQPRKKNVFWNKLSLNPMSNYKQNWQIKVLSKKMDNMKKNTEGLKTSIYDMMIFKEQIKDSMIDLEKKIQRLNHPNQKPADSDNIETSVGDQNEKSGLVRLNEAIEESESKLVCRLYQETNDVCNSENVYARKTGIIRNEFEKLITLNESRLDFLACLMDQLQIINSDDHRADLINQLHKILSNSLPNEILTKSTQISDPEENWEIKRDLNFLQSEIQTNEQNELNESIHSGDDFYSNFRVNPIYDNILSNLDVKTEHFDNIDNYEFSKYSMSQRNKIANNEWKRNEEIKTVIDSIDEILKPRVDDMFDYSLKEEVYQKIIKEFENLINKELSMNKFLDSKMLFTEVNDKSYNDFFNNYISQGVWSCLSVYDNISVEHCLEDMYSNLSSFLLKQYKTIISIEDKMKISQSKDSKSHLHSVPSENDKDVDCDIDAPMAQHEQDFLPNNLEQLKELRNGDQSVEGYRGLSEYLYEGYFMQGGTTHLGETFINVINKSLHQLDAGEKDWVCQAEKKETDQNIENVNGNMSDDWRK